MKRKSFLRSLCLGVLALGCFALPGHAQLEVRASFKILLDANNAPPPSSGGFATDANVRATVDDANAWLTRFGRGIRFRVIEVTNLPGHAELLDTDCQATSDQIEAGVLTNSASYGWRPNAMNVYITRGNNVGGACAFNGLLVLHWDDNRTPLAHEGGHYLGLAHTQGPGCTDCDTCTTNASDGISDTLPDRQCWRVDDISTNAYGKVFTNLNATQQAAVSNTFNNVMSYHKNITNDYFAGTKDVLTPGQWDRIADFTRTNRATVMNGQTLFVDNTTPACSARDGFSECFGANVGGPFLTVTQGIARAMAGDIVLIRRGNYNEAMIINKAITLRATRGDALIGIP